MLRTIDELVGWTITDVEAASRLEPVSRMYLTITDGNVVRRIGLTARPLIASDLIVDASPSPQ